MVPKAGPRLPAGGGVPTLRLHLHEEGDLLVCCSAGTKGFPYSSLVEYSVIPIKKYKKTSRLWTKLGGISYEKNKYVIEFMVV